MPIYIAVIHCTIRELWKITCWVLRMSPHSRRVAPRLGTHLSCTPLARLGSWNPAKKIEGEATGRRTSKHSLEGGQPFGSSTRLPFKPHRPQLTILSWPSSAYNQCCRQSCLHAWLSPEEQVRPHLSIEPCNEQRPPSTAESQILLIVQGCVCCLSTGAACEDS